MELAALIADVSGRLLLTEASPGPQVKKGKCISKFPNAFLSTLCMLLATWNYCQRRESLKEQSVVPQSPNQWPWEGNFLSSHRTSDRCLANLLLKTSHNSFSSLPSSFCFVLLSPHSWFAGSPGIHHKDVQHWSGEQLSQKQHHSPAWGTLPLPFAGTCQGFTEHRQPARWGQRTTSKFHKRLNFKAVYSVFHDRHFQKVRTLASDSTWEPQNAAPQNDTYPWRVSARECIIRAQGSQCSMRQLNIMLDIAVTCNLVILEMKNGLSMQLLS